MNSIVCIKAVPDPDSTFTLDENGNVQLESVPLVPSLYDEHAVEAAVALKEALGGQVTALSAGGPKADQVVLHALAMDADLGVLVEHSAPLDLDSRTTATILAEAVRRLGPFDLILCGQEAADSGAGTVGPTLALLLDIPFLTCVTKIEKVEAGLRVERMAEGGYDVLECPLPALLTVGSQVNHPRYPSAMKFFRAKRTGITRWPIQDLLTDRASVEAILLPGKRHVPTVVGECTFLDGQTSEDLAGGFVTLLSEKGFI